MKTIIAKELRDHLQSGQFITLLALSMILFSASGLMSTAKFRSQSAAYLQRIELAHKHPSTVGVFIYPEPSPLRFLAEGGDKALPYGYQLTPMGVLDPLPSGAQNPKMPEIPEIDWAFMVKVVFSLYAILLGYGIIASEKEDGTVRLVLANPLGRIRFLTAKVIAGLATLLIPLAAGIVLNLVIIGIGNPGVFSPHLLIRTLMMILLSVIFILVFILFAALFSSLIGQSSMALFLLLVVWFCFVTVIPNSAGVIAQRLFNVPSEYQISRTYTYGQKELLNKKIAPIIDLYAKGEIRSESDFREKTDNLYIDNEKLRIAWEIDYRRAMRQRLRVARNISRISPVGLFQFAAENMAMTGYANEARFREDAERYSLLFDSYVKSKVRKLVPLIKGMLTLREDGGIGGITGGSSMGGISSSGQVMEGKQIFVSAPLPEAYQGDMPDFPWFVDTPPSVIDSLKRAMPDLAGLLIWSLVLSLLAIGAVIRADLR